MMKKVPIIKLSAPESLWLQEAYQAAKENTRIDYKQIWSKLYGKIPNTFRPVSMDAKLVSSDGEEIRLLGVVALEKNYSVLGKINKMVLSIKDILLERPHEENISADEISQVTKLSVSEISFLFSLVRYYGSFWNSASYDGHFTLLKSIGVGRDSGIFYRYIGFSSIEEVILNSINQNLKDEQFKQVIPLKVLGSEDEPEHNNYISVNPLFKSRVEKVNQKLCFVLMPFKEEWSQRVYRDILRENIESLGLQCLRADDLTGQNIIEDIWIGINQASVVIADVTNTNPNVMYELGIAHTIGKPSVLITQDINTIPFDFRHLRHIQYRENTEAVKTFATQFREHLLAVYAKDYPHVKLNKVRRS